MSAAIDSIENKTFSSLELAKSDQIETIDLTYQIQVYLKNVYIFVLIKSFLKNDHVSVFSKYKCLFSKVNIGAWFHLKQHFKKLLCNAVFSTLIAFRFCQTEQFYSMYSLFNCKINLWKGSSKVENIVSFSNNLVRSKSSANTKPIFIYVEMVSVARRNEISLRVCALKSKIT